jgi:hypothetical protein
MRDYSQLEFFESKVEGRWISDFINPKDVNKIIKRLKKEFPTGKIENLGVYTTKEGPYTGLIRLKITFDNDPDESFFLFKIPTVNFGVFK